ncbi:MAG: GNAT family N-acetyltransferase [Alphaproteobacteria bacterium HGW-Alphaproteobacteria-6]|nr:MAG: GNAT family N-acetyltransferase [Alphaproteobacteria bacterium HGW-Alphaproteobacteria-6]
MTAATEALTLRPIAATDRADWQRLWRAYLDFYQTRLPAEVYDTTFSRLIGNEGAEFRGLIARIDGRAVGLVHYLFHRTCWAIDDTCYLQDLYADPAVRGQGIGRVLIEAVYAAADAHGAAGVYWLTQADNTTARRLYDRIGTLTPFVKYRRG